LASHTGSLAQAKLAVERARVNAPVILSSFILSVFIYASIAEPVVAPVDLREFPEALAKPHLVNSCYKKTKST